MIKHIPNYYRPMFPGGPEGPLRWQDDVSGVLPAAMLAFFAGDSNKAEPFTSFQFDLVREYGEYYINAPCWDWNPHLTEEGKQELAHMRSRITEVKTAQELNAWIHECLDIGIDPF